MPQCALHKVSSTTMQILRHISQYNWVGRTSIFTLRDEITNILRDIVLTDLYKPYSQGFQRDTCVPESTQPQ